ncbi:MAG: hypothetical protein ACREQA_21010 [Candidatus Binatia bacterium]
MKDNGALTSRQLRVIQMRNGCVFAGVIFHRPGGINDYRFVAAFGVGEGRSQIGHNVRFEGMVF